jgi:hypothetical protein
VAGHLLYKLKERKERREGGKRRNERVSKGTTNAVKRQPIQWGKIFTNHT